jgi:hypothetical protein
MTRFLISAAALLALTAAANAVEMPKEFRGHWCEASTGYIRVTLSEFLKGKTRATRNCAEPIHIDRKGMHWEENTCEPLRAHPKRLDS